MLKIATVSRSAITALERAAKIAQAEVMKALKRAASRVQRQAKINVRQALNTTGKSKGYLARSIVTQANASRLEVAIGPTAIYGRVHELGGVIRPKRGKYLAIPMTDEAQKQNAREFPRPLHVVSTGGRAFLVESSETASTFQYVLKTSVRMPKRPYMQPALKATEPWIENDLRGVADYIMGGRAD